MIKTETCKLTQTKPHHDFYFPYFLKAHKYGFEHTVLKVKTKSQKFDMYWQVKIKLHQTAYIHDKSITGLDLAWHFDT